MHWPMDLPDRTPRLRTWSTTTRALRAADGFTLIELLIVVMVIGILLAIAVPAYSKMTTRAESRTAEQQIRAAMPAAHAFYLDNDTYVGLGNGKKKNPPGIASYDDAIAVTVGTGAKGKPTATTYCLNARAVTTISAAGPSPITWYQKKNCTGAGSTSAP